MLIAGMSSAVTPSCRLPLQLSRIILLTMIGCAPRTKITPISFVLKSPRRSFACEPSPVAALGTPVALDSNTEFVRRNSPWCNSMALNVAKVPISRVVPPPKAIREWSILTNEVGPTNTPPHCPARARDASSSFKVSNDPLPPKRSSATLVNTIGCSVVPSAIRCEPNNASIREPFSLTTTPGSTTRLPCNLAMFASDWVSSSIPPANEPSSTNCSTV